MTTLFKKTKGLVTKIDTFMDLTEESSLHFKEAIKLYLDNRLNEFEERLQTIRETESQGDTLKKDIESQLYGQTLIPESRGDVLGILESMDSVIDRTKSILLEFSIEKPDIPGELKEPFLELTEPVIKTVQSLVRSARAFFYDINSIKDHLHLVKFYEKEADKLAEKIKRKVFSLDIELSHKLHLRNFIMHIDILADKSEEVGDRLAIATIKRIV